MDDITETVSSLLKIKKMTVTDEDSKNEGKFWLEVFLMSVAVSVAVSFTVRGINKLFGW
jgi:hypothetical protein